MNLTLKNKKLVFRHLSVIFGGSACIALLHAAVDMTSIAIMDASGALIFLLLMAAMGLTLWGMLAPSGQPKSEHLSERLADAAPSFSGAFILFGGLWSAGAGDVGALVFIWFVVFMVVFVLSRLLVGQFLTKKRLNRE